MNDPIGIILKHEGGFTAHKSDKGNYHKGVLVGTNFGITGTTLSNWLGRDATMEDVKNMDVDTARRIYEQEYLIKPKIDMFPEPPRTLVLDMAINHGPSRAIKIVQKVIDLAGFGPCVVDGRMGPNTARMAENAAREMGPYFQNAIVDERANFYNRIVESNASQRVFLNGWLRRANSFRIALEE